MSKLILQTKQIPGATAGVLQFPDGSTIHTLEEPWRSNAPQVSCIPAGVYKLVQRGSAIINRLTKGKRLSGWNVSHVPNRSFIMFHQGNTVDDTEGCILLGKSRGTLNGKPAVLSSKVAFEEFMVKMEELAKSGDIYLEVIRG